MEYVVSILVSVVTGVVAKFLTKLFFGRSDGNTTRFLASNTFTGIIMVVAFIGFRFFAYPLGTFGTQEIELGDSNNIKWEEVLEEQKTDPFNLSVLYEISDNVDYTEVGEYDVTIRIENKLSGISKDVSINVKVVDTVSPTISCEDFDIVYGDTVWQDFNNQCVISDESDIDTIEMTEGTVDISIPNTYTIKVTATDSSNNTGDANVRVTVLNMSDSQKNTYITNSISGFEFNDSNLNLVAGDTVLPDSLSNGEISISWSSSNVSAIISNVLKYDEIESLSEITAVYEYEGYTLTKTYNVIQMHELNINSDTEDYYSGEDYNLLASFNYEDISFNDVQISLSLKGTNASTYLFDSVTLDDYLSMITISPSGDMAIGEVVPEYFEFTIAFEYGVDITSIDYVIGKTSTSYNGFDGGDGTDIYPYLVSTITQLDKVRDSLTSDFLMINDIDMVSNDWISIGSDGNNYIEFTGVFDGGNYSLSNFNSTQTLMFNDGDRAYGGLFATIGSNAVIKNLSLINVNLNYGVEKDGNSTDVYIGAVAGAVYTGTIDNTFVSGNIDFIEPGGGEAFVGGIAGRVKIGTISNSTNAASVDVERGSAVAGGIVGLAGHRDNAGEYDINIIDCKNTGPVRAEMAIFGGWSNAGGIVGRVGSADNSLKITRVINLGSVIAIGSISNTGKYYGGILGEAYQGLIVVFTEAYSLTDTTSRTVGNNSSNPVGSESLSVSELEDSTLYSVDWDEAWDISVSEVPNLK